MSEKSSLYEAARRRLRELMTLYEASQACLSIPDQKGLLKAIIEAAARATDATLGSVMLIDEEKGEYIFGAHYGLSEKTIAALEAELHIPLGKGLVGAVVTAGRPVVVPDVTADPRWVPMKTELPIRAFLGVPLVGRDGQPLGALTLSHPEVGAFDKDHAMLLATFANQAALAIENARLYEQAQARSRYLETLQRINATLRSTLPLSEVLATIAQNAGEALGYVGSLIGIPDASGRRLVLGAAWGNRFLEAATRFTGLGVASFSLPLTAEENPMARAYLKNEIQAWSRAPERIVVGVEPPISPRLAPLIERGMGAKLAVCVPLPFAEKVVGVLVAFSPREQLPEEERALLLGLADQAGLAIENARLYEQAQQESLERKRVIEVLRESEERYRRLVELSFEAIVIHREGKIIYINATGAELLGASGPEALIGKSLLDFVHPDYLETAKERMRETIRGGVAPLTEEKLVRLDGAVVDVEVVEIPITYHGQPAVQVVVRDITQRKRAGEALRASQALLHSLIESLPQNVFSKDLEGRFTFANQRYCQTEGKSLAEIIGKTDFDLHPPDLARKYREDDRRVIETGQIFETVEEHQPLDGKRFYVQVIKAPLYDAQGRVNGILGIFWDITERKRAEEALRASEERYRALYEDNPSMYFTVDPAGTVLSVNRFGAEQLGYTVEELVGQSVFNVFHENDKQVARQQLVTCLQNPGEIARWELRKVCKDGSVLWVKEAARAVRDADGNPVVLIVCEDITERKKLEEQLRQAQKMEAIGSLAGGIAHDFNNLLTPIGGFAELLLWQAPEGSQQREYLRQIKLAADRAAALTHQLLTFARGPQVEMRPLNLNDIVHEVIGLLEHAIDRAIAIEPHLADDLATIEGDAGQIHQVLLNLCLNARDAMPRGGRLIIETRNVTLSEAKARTDLDLQAGQYVLLSVTDTGIGMDAETQRHLFEPFFTTKEQGRGLGLATAYGIVRGHGGAIHVYSEPGQGSTFKVYLPTARRLAKDIAPRPEEAEVVGGTETVLVIDDEEPVRELLQRILEEGGYTVLLATNGVEAIELYAERSTEIDLVVLDIIMPQMGGLETYKRLREINPEVKVLLTSGYSENGQAQDILAAGARGFLQKPYDLYAVLRKVREGLGS